MIQTEAVNATNADFPMPQAVVSELAPTGVLRAAINMGNFLLVTGSSPSGDPTGVSPDMAAAIAARLGVPVKYMPYARPGEIAERRERVWDIGLIGAEPQRAEKIDFTAAYCEIEATYLVPAGSPIRSIAEVDQPGRRVAVTARSAYGLWLENNYQTWRSAAVRQCPSSPQGIRRREDRRLCRIAAGPDRSAETRPARGFSTASSPRCNRRSARRRRMRPGSRF